MATLAHLAPRGKAMSIKANGIANIVNFMRLPEPRDAGITGDVLFASAAKQAARLRGHGLPATFLMRHRPSGAWGHAPSMCA